ncbi:MAG: hypothetical protein DRJ56_01210 [Thermoprotei archaeon]|nr:MAG: hypothetical protein DRJ56_01210 [Thermoprotei archaeon]
MEPFDYERYSRLAERNRERLEIASRFEEPDRVPVVIGVGGPYYAKLFGYTLAEYYNDLSVMLDAQAKGIKWRLTVLKDDLSHVGFWLDVGSVAEGIVFNCKVVMPDDSRPWQSPWIVPRIKTLEDIDELEVPDPREQPGVRRYYERLEEFKRLVRSHYGDVPVGGGLQIHPPVSAAGSLMGPGRLYAWLYRYPSDMHKLFRKLEETFVALQEYYYEVTGSEPGSLGLCDDHAGYLSREMYERFALPYNLRLYERFGQKSRSLHMDSHMDHITDILTNIYRIGYADVGVENDVRILAEAFKGRVVFKGNANWRALLSGKLEPIEVEVERCIFHAAEGGGYIFDNGGETYVNVPPSALKYEVEYAKRVGRYPIRPERFRHLKLICGR